MRIQFTGTAQESHPFMSSSGTMQHVTLRFHALLCKSPSQLHDKHGQQQCLQTT